MTKNKQPKARIPAHDNERLKDALGDTTIDDFLTGAIYDLLDGDLDEEYYEKIAQLRELEGETSEIDGRIDRIDDRIEVLKEERERLAEERDEKEERIEQIEEKLSDRPATADGGVDAGRSSVEDVAFGVLVDVAHEDIGVNGLTAGTPGIREAALRAGIEPDELILELREMAQPAGEELNQYDDLVERSFLTENESPQKRPGEMQFDQLREQIAEEVLDGNNVDWDEVPSPGIDF